MGTALHAFIVFCVILLIGFLLFRFAMHYAARMMHKKVSALSIFKDFSQKMSMTIGLGIFFFGLYLLSIYLVSFVMDPEVRLHLFFLVYKHPIVFIYLGLFTFACTTAGIYFARIVIKHLYNTRRRG